MKRKSLLILLPIAAMAFAGCTPVAKPCSEAKITIPDGKQLVNIKKGENAVLEYQISDDSCKKEIAWSTSNPAIATVSNGIVTGVGVGTATIKANDGVSWTVVVADLPKPVAALDSIAVLPGKTDYKVGEFFDKTNAIVVANYSDGTSKQVTTFNVDKNDALTVDDKVVVFSYTENNVTKTFNYPISVTADPSPDVTLTKIVVTKQPTKVDYFAGEEFDPAGLEVTAHYSDGNSKVVTENLSFNKKVLALEDTKVVVTYTEGVSSQSADIDVNVTSPSEVTLVRIEITSEPAKKEYFVGDTFSSAGLEVTAYYSNSTSNVVAATCSSPDMSTKGSKDVTVSYTEGAVTKEAYFTILVKERTVTTITPQEAIELMDAAGEGNVVEGLQQVKGICASGSKYESQHKEYTTGFEGVSNFKLQFTDTNNILNGGSPDGMEIVVEGYLEKYQGKYQLSYLPPAASPTGEKFTPNLISATQQEQKEVIEVLSVKTAPESVAVSGTITPSSVILNVKLNDGSESTAAATRVECNTQAAADSVEATAWYNEVGSAKFNIKVVAQGQPVYGTEDNPISVTQALETMNIDCPNDKDLTKQAMYCTGTIKEIKNVYHYEGDIGSDCYELYATDGTNDVYVYRLHCTDDLKDSVVVGAQIKWMGFGKNFKDTLEFVDNGATKCTLLNNGTPTPPQKEVVEVLSVKTAPESVAVGGTITPSSVILNVKLNDGSESTAAATRVECNTQAVADSVEATAWYNEVGSAKFNIKIVAQSQPVYGTEDNPISVTQALETMGIDCPNDKDLTKQAMYCTGTINEIKNVYHYEGDIGSDCYELYATDGTNDVYVYRLHCTDDLKDSVVVGAQIKWMGFGKNFKGTLEFVDNGATKCTLLDNGTPTPPQKEITVVELQGTLAKSSYVAGQTFDPSGLSLKVTYDDQSEETVTSGFTFNVTNPLEVGEYDLKATYQGHTTEGSVHISVVAKELVSIAITHGMSKTTYQVGDEWNPAGIVVSGSYNDGSVVTLESGSYTLEYDPESATDTTVTSVNIVATMVAGSQIKSPEYSQTVSVQTEPVVDPVLDSISVANAQGKTNEYTEGDVISKDDLVVTAHYTQGKADAVVTDYTISLTRALATTDTSATITYSEAGVEKTATYTFTVAEKPAPTDPVVGVTFEKVNSNTDLTDGTYIIGTELGYFFNGEDVAKEAVFVSELKDSIIGVEGMAGIEVKSVDGGYSLKVINGTNEGKYIGPKSGNDKNIVFGDSPVAHEISFTDGVTVVKNGDKKLMFNKASDQLRFRYYTTAQTDIVLYKAVAAKTVKAVAIEGSLTNTIQYVGDHFDPTGLSVKVTYDDNTFETVTSGLTWSVDVLSAANPALAVSVSYKGTTSSNSVNVEVVAKTIQSIYIDNGLTTKKYTVGDAWASDEVVVKAKWSVGPDTILDATAYDLAFNPTAPAKDVTSVKITATYKAGGVAAAELTVTGIEVTESQGTLTEVYSLVTSDYKGSNNAYASNCNIECGDVSWNFNGNSEQQPWRFGGKNIGSGAQRTLYSLDPISEEMEIDTAIVSIGKTGGGCTFNSMTFEVYSSASGAANGTSSDLVESIKVTSPKAETDYTFEADEVDSWKGMYIRILFDVTVTDTKSNKYFEFLGITFKGIN